MMIGLVWIISCYAAGIAIIHALHWRSRRRGNHRMTHYVLRTKNNGHQVEWYLRSLYFFSWMKGRTIQVTLADEGSTDDTIAIASRLSTEHNLNIQLLAQTQWDEWVREHEHEQVVVVRLNQSEGLETAFKLI